MSKFIVTKAEIIKINKLTDSIFDFTVKSPELAKKAVCGQFLHIDCGDEFVLRRPISIAEIFDDALRFIFDIRGKGTQKLSEKKVGEFLDILGPLGNGFEILNEKSLIVGGGIGIYPLLQIVKEQKAKTTVSLGFRNKDFVTLEDEFRKYADELYISTDDGSYGENGNALSVVKQRLEKGDFDVVYACGPLPMIKAIKEITDRCEILCQISLEERMGCGIGACLCCPVKIEDDTELGFKHLHVCKEGPIFNAKEVIF
jgi:dihydroorotate dehydrogenase electron transfer subunit